MDHQIRRDAELLGSQNKAIMTELAIFPGISEVTLYLGGILQNLHSDNITDDFKVMLMWFDYNDTIANVTSDRTYYRSPNITFFVSTHCTTVTLLSNNPVLQ